MTTKPPPRQTPDDGIDTARERRSPLYEWPQTERITVLMEAVFGNNVKSVARMVNDKGIIWNQKGPCGRTPERAARDLGHLAAYAMLLAIREKAELAAQSISASVQGPKRL